MKPDKVIPLSGGHEATLKEITVKSGLALLEAINQQYGGMDELIFEATDELVKLVGDDIVISKEGKSVQDMTVLTGSDWDNIATAFVEQSKSFLARAAKKKARQKAAEAKESETTPDQSTDPLSR
ncbi:MAG: hypothetical protein WAW36_18905 [Methylovulum miyakonense]|uniref:hypothetical protein n=1 Tax=Methylovulum miyakonense TaxID=645578 RepID=UPI003BB4F34F